MSDDYVKRELSALASLEGRVAVVTGAAQGFGYAIAERLAEASAALGLLKSRKSTGKVVLTTGRG